MKTDLVVGSYIFHKDKVLLIHHRKLDMWLGVGGHIDPNEIPDDAIKREIHEETGLLVEFLQPNTLPVTHQTIKGLANPFHVNVHSVGDHNHCCFYYVMRALNAESMKINNELKDARWFSKEELEEDIVPEDVRHQALAAFHIVETQSLK